MPQLKKQSFQAPAKGGDKTKDAASVKSATKTPTPVNSTQVKKSTVSIKPTSHRLLDDDEDDTTVSSQENSQDDEDEVIASAIKSKKDNKSKNPKFIIGGIVVVVAVAFCFLLFKGKKEALMTPSVDDNSTTMQDTLPSQPSTNPANPTAPKTPGGTPSTQPSPIEEGAPDDLNVGTQDFRQNTTMNSTSALTSPDDFIKDLYGLSLQTNFTVNKIQDATDFVNYTKKRGTWGGGLELYYLDAEYKGNKYVVQVPFKYYKELDDTGIVPVKMEVLRIKSETDGNFLTVISYMCLDEKTLESVLKTQSK